MIEELIQFIGFISSIHWGDFLCVTVYIPAHQLHTTPHASHIIIREMTFYFLLHSSSSFRISSFNPFCTDLYSPLSFFLVRKFLPVYFGTFFFLQFSVELHALHRIQHIHTLIHLVHWYHLLSQQKHPISAVYKSLKVLNSISRPLLMVRVTVGSLAPKTYI